MELKDFIKKSIQDIIDATQELIHENASSGAYINPAAGGVFAQYVTYDNGFVPITTVEFDVAVTEGTQKEGSGGLKVDVAALRLGADGKAATAVENASRIKFSMGVVLPHVRGPKSNERLLG